MDRATNGKNYLIFAIICFVISAGISLFALVNECTAAEKELPIPADLHRNYTSQLLINGKLAIAINHKYIGKSPKGKYRSKHNYKVIDTDFYNETLTNYTPYVIEFLELKTWPERATNAVNVNTEKGIKKTSSVTTLDLTKLWRNNKFPPHKTSVKYNMYYYSKGKNWNRRYLQYKVRINGKIYLFTDTLVYIK